MLLGVPSLGKADLRTDFQRVLPNWTFEALRRIGGRPLPQLSATKRYEPDTILHSTSTLPACIPLRLR